VGRLLAELLGARCVGDDQGISTLGAVAEDWIEALRFVVAVPAFSRASPLPQVSLVYTTFAYDINHCGSGGAAIRLAREGVSSGATDLKG
jgi:acetyl-CoA acetyltransferase